MTPAKEKDQAEKPSRLNPGGVIAGAVFGLAADSDLSDLADVISALTDLIHELGWLLY